MSEWVYTRVNDTFHLFGCGEILLALRKLGTGVGLHVICDCHSSCVYLGDVPSCFLCSSLSLLIHSLSAVIEND